MSTSLLPFPAAQVVTEEKYDRRKYALWFNPSIQNLGLDNIYDFLEFIMSNRNHGNYLGSPFPKAMLFRNKLQVSRLEDLPTSFHETAYENLGSISLFQISCGFPFSPLFSHPIWGGAAIPHRCRHFCSSFLNLFIYEPTLFFT